jgi:YidC/Oxa1 family membrane protein insertase
MLVFANIFQPLIDIFEAVIKFFHTSLGLPWGWAIVLLTVVMRALLIPLAIKQFHSMQRMQAHMPELKKIQQKYKDDKQRQQQEMAKFYKDNQVNPLGSCAPMLAQIPVFISLFYMLRKQLRRDICPQIQTRTYDIHHHLVLGTSKACGSHGASFLFIHDLTSSATGVTLVVLMVLYVGSMLASSLLLSPPTMERQQRIMMIVLPLFLSVIVINFPTGVLVYWITTNLWTMGQQYLIRARLGPTTVVAATGGDVSTNGDAESPPARSGGLLARARGEKPVDGASDSRPKERAGAAPPPPPRKRKKRSGRRR